MFKLKRSPAAAAGTAALISLLVLPAAAQDQKKTDKPPQDVNVVNAVPAYPGVPPNAFSVTRRSFTGVLNVDPGGTGYAISSLTVSNHSFTTMEAVILVFGGAREVLGDFCENEVHSLNFSQGPTLRIPAGETVHLSFPQPYVLPAKPGEASCLMLRAPAVGWSASVVGYRLPPAAPQQQ